MQQIKAMEIPGGWGVKHDPPETEISRGWGGGLIGRTIRGGGGYGYFLESHISSLVVSASQELGGYEISHQNNLKLHSGYHTC